MNRTLARLAALWLTATTVAAQPGTLRWSTPTGGVILSSPALALDGTIYVGSYDQKLYAINGATGATNWAFSVAPGGNDYAFIFSSPAVGPDGTIYFGTEVQPSRNRRSGRFYALNPNGTLKWVRDFADAIYSDPAIAPDGTVYFGGYDTNVYAYSPAGDLLWKCPVGDQVYSDPVIGADGTLYVGCDNGRLYAIRSNGTKQWEFDTGSRAITGSPALGADGRIYVGVGSVFNPRLYSVNPDATTNWVFTAAHQINSSPALGRDGTIYFGCVDRRLYALRPDGTQKWEYLAPASIDSSPALARDGTVYFGCNDGQLYALDASGAKQWSYPTGSYLYSSPVVGPSGTVYIGSADASLHAVQGASGLACGPWPMLRRNPLHAAKSFAPPEVMAVSSTAGSFHLRISGAAGQSYEILASQDLDLWTAFACFTSRLAVTNVADPTAGTRLSRFFRVSSW